MKDFLVRRDGEGKIVPFEVDVVGLKLRIAILPTTIGSLKSITQPDKDAIQWPIPDKIAYVREHVVDPDFSLLTEDEMMESLTMWDLDMLLVTAVQNGGPTRRIAEGNGSGAKKPRKRSTRKRGKKV